jgi:hypothetical protein
VRILATWLCVFMAPAVLAAGNPQVDRQAVEFTLDVCAELVGDDPARLPAAVRALKGVKVPAARPVVDSPPGFQKALTGIMHVAPDAALHKVGFESGAALQAWLRPDLKDCQIQVIGPSEAHLRVMEQLVTKSEWREGLRTPGTGQVWQRRRENGVLVTLSIAEVGEAASINFTTSLPELPWTARDFDAFANSVIRPCIELSVSDSPPDIDRFAPDFMLHATRDGNQILDSVSETPGGRLILAPRPNGASCTLLLREFGEKAFDIYWQAFEDAFKRLPGATLQEKPVHLWRATPTGSNRSVAMGATVEKDILVLVIARE